MRGCLLTLIIGFLVFTFGGILLVVLGLALYMLEILLPIAIGVGIILLVVSLITGRSVKDIFSAKEDKRHRYRRRK